MKMLARRDLHLNDHYGGKPIYEQLARAKLQHWRLFMTVQAAHFQRCLTILKQHGPELDFVGVEIDNSRPSKCLKQLAAIERSLKKTTCLHRLTSLAFTNLSQPTQFQSVVLRLLLRLNQSSLEAVTLTYTHDIIKEETRVLVQDFTLHAFPLLRRLELRRNFGAFIPEVCESASNLESLNLAENSLNSQQCALVIRSVSPHRVRHINLNFNLLGREAATELCALLKTSTTLQTLALVDTHFVSH